MVHVFVYNPPAIGNAWADLGSTGASGFIGGDALYEVTKAHPKYTFSALVRSDSSASEISAQYPDLKIVRGDLNDVKTVEEESKKSDVVLNLATSNHISSVKAIVSGLSSRENGGTLLQISGASILSYAEISAGTYGSPSSQILSDIADLPIIRSLTAAHPSRPVDTYLLTLSNPKVKTAIVCAPCIYGVGRGAGNIDSMQIPDLVIAALKSGEGVMPGEGKSRWGMVHVSDLSTMFAGLIGKSITTTADETGIWNEEGYYFSSTDEKSWGELAGLIAKEAYKEKLINGEEVKAIDKDEMDGLVGDSTLFGISARVVSNRAEKILGWKKEAEGVEGEVVRVVKEEAKKLAKGN